MYDRRFCDYNSYFIDQAGGNLDIAYYRAFPYQRGYGRFSQLFKKFGIPAGKYLFKHIFEMGKNVFGDIQEGKDLKESLKSNLRKQTASAVHDLGDKIRSQTGSGLRRKPRSRKTKVKRSPRKPKKAVKKRRKRKAQPKFRYFMPRRY